MAKILDFKDNKVVITPEALSLIFFKKLWDNDKSKTKDKATKDIQYVFFYTDFNSPYYIYPENQREDYIKEYVVGSDYKVSKDVEEAIIAYKELNTTPAMKQLEAAFSALNKSEQYLKSVDYTLMDSNGRFLYDPEKVQKMIIAMPKLMEALNQAKDICMKELSTETKVRGGASISLFE